MRQAKLLFFLVALAAALFAGLYLSGLVLFWRLDMPWARMEWLDYWRYWSAYSNVPAHAGVIKSSGVIGFALPLLVLVALTALMLFRKKPNLYGEARFATAGDLRERRMLKPEETALVVGKKDGKFVYFNGLQFALLAAPTRSGKGVGIVIPNLLSYQGSVVVLDIKQENFDLTSGFRARYGQDVYLFNPFAEDRRTHRWNPLSYVSKDEHFRISDLQSIAAMLYPVSDLHKDPFWANQAQNAFVAARPPGHHAETAKAMGFCLFGTVAIAAKRALDHHGLARVAIVDFDVHHGNGTQDLLWDEPRALFASSHQMPLYPGSGSRSETGAHGQIINVPLREGSGGGVMREAYETLIFPRIAAWKPELILISAGFDAHADDPLAGLEWQARDFGWITGRICDLADEHCQGRVVSCLEGGYDLAALQASALAHVGVLQERGQ